jgi:hypothetical protein
MPTGKIEVAQLDVPTRPDDNYVGFCEPPTPTFLHIQASEDGSGSCWHYFKADDTQVNVPVRGLAGYIKEIICAKGEFNGRPTINLRIVFAAERTWIIQSGVSTTFSRGVLLALEQLDDIKQKLIISTAMGDRGAVYGDVYLFSGSRVEAKWDRDKPLSPIVKKLQVKLGQEPQDMKALQPPKGNAAPAQPPPRQQQAPPPRQQQPQQSAPQQTQPQRPTQQDVPPDGPPDGINGPEDYEKDEIPF